jgi:hypothetical protein
MKKLLKNKISLRQDNPDLCLEWNHNKNTEFSPELISPCSSKKVWWVCETGHEWKASVSDRNNKIRKRGCPYCSGKKVCNDNSFGVKFPSLILEWHEKNKLTPYDYTYGSKKRVWWKCSFGHEWESQIFNRSSGRKCPYCCPTNKKVCKSTSLAALNPNLSKEWNFEKNVNLYPESVTVNSGKTVWWKCKTCGREWQSSISNRNNLGNGCPFCCGITLKDGTHCDSMSEAYMYIKYIGNGKEFIMHYRYGEEMGRSKCDFYFPRENKYVEVTGYHKNSKNYINYLRGIVKKKRYVLKLGAKFEFIQIKQSKNITNFVLGEQDYG